MTRMLPALAVSALAFAAMATPLAAKETSRNAVTLSYADLDLTSEAGANALLRRVDRAARQVCGITHAQRGLFQRQRRQCVAETVGETVAKIDAPVVTQMHATREGQRMIFAAR